MTDSRSLTRYDGPRSIEELRQYATLLAGTSLSNGNYARNETLPAAFRGNPAAVAFAVEYGKALDVSPVTALIGIHIVDGKPTASAGLISALIRRAGHKIRTWTEGTYEAGDLTAITTVHRSDDPEFEYRSTWTLDRAVRAGLMEKRGEKYIAAKPKSAWATYPENMLKARSITEVARDAAEDAVLGVHYTPEELGVDVDEAGEPVYTVTTVPTPEQQSPPPATATPPATAPAATPIEDVDAEAIDELRDLILDSTEREELEALWTGPIIAGSAERAQGLTVGDADGSEVSILWIFQHIGQAVADGKLDDLAAIRARFGLVPVDEGVPDPPSTDDLKGDDGEAGTPASSPEESSGPTSDAAAPEAAETENAPEAAPTAAHGPKNGPEGPQLRTLNLTADRMTAAQRNALVEYVTAWNLSPSKSEEDAAKVCSAIATGVIGDLIRATGGADPDPVELVSEAQLAVAREVEEAREEARQAAGATPPETKSTPSGKAAAAAEARKAAAAAKAKGANK